MSLSLTYRLATEADFLLLQQYRKECGWGLNRLLQHWGNPDRPLCVFSLDRDGTVEGVGMGGWILEIEGDPDAASRAQGNVEISSLFIRKQYQKLGLGSRAMDLLEIAAVEEHNAKMVTLDTAAYLCDLGEHGFVTVEHEDIPNPTIAWYEKRGYRRYRPVQPRFPHPTADDPDRLIIAIDLRISAEEIVRRRRAGNGNGFA